MPMLEHSSHDDHENNTCIEFKYFLAEEFDNVHVIYLKFAISGGF